MLSPGTITERFFGAAGTSNGRDGHQEQAEDKGHRYYITLAPISSGEDEQSNCSSAVYDSIHNRETGEITELLSTFLAHIPFIDRTVQGRLQRSNWDRWRGENTTTRPDHVEGGWIHEKPCHREKREREIPRQL